MARRSQLANMEADASPQQPKVPGVCSEEENLPDEESDPPEEERSTRLVVRMRVGRGIHFLLP